MAIQATRDLIYALATGAPGGAIAVLRATGAGARDALAVLLREDPPRPRRAALRPLYDATDRDETLDQALVLWFPGPKSYSGEDMFELHVHGGPAVVDSVARALERIGARLAQPGEFSRRAVLNGKLDLTQAEAVAALVAAETRAQQRHAQKVLSGAVGPVVKAWRQRAIDVLGLCETQIDFIDESLGAELENEAATRLGALAADVEAHLESVAAAEASFGVPVCALLGPPNAGKSSLVNAILADERIIVSDVPGTTRDAIRVRARRGPLTVEIVDTAGLRATRDPIEAEGVRRARREAARADLRLLLLSADTIGAWDREDVDEDAVFWTKADLAPHAPNLPTDAAIQAVSIKDATAVEAFWALVSRSFKEGDALSPFAGSERRRKLLEDFVGRIRAAEKELAAGRPELVGPALRSALDMLAAMIGDISSEDVLDQVFSRFCIGK